MIYDISGFARRRILAAAAILALPGCATRLPDLDPYPTSQAVREAGSEIAAQALREGDYNLAAEMLDGLRRQPHAPPSLVCEEASALEKAGRAAEAEDLLKTYIDDNKGDLAATRQLANLMLQRGELVAALAVIDGAVAAGGDPLLLNTRGAILDRMGRQEEARQAYRSALAIKPYDPTIACNLGLSLLLSGDRAAAYAAVTAVPLEAALREKQGWNMALLYVTGGHRADAAKLLAAIEPAGRIESSLRRLDAMGALPPADLLKMLSPQGPR